MPCPRQRTPRETSSEPIGPLTTIGVGAEARLRRSVGLKVRLLGCRGSGHDRPPQDSTPDCCPSPPAPLSRTRVRGSRRAAALSECSLDVWHASEDDDAMDGERLTEAQQIWL